MATKVFIAATAQHCGKTTMSVCLMQLARERYRSVGFIKPVGQEYVSVAGREVDKDTALFAGTFGLEADLAYMSPVVARHEFTRQVLDGVIRTEALRDRIATSVAELERRHDFLIIEGTGHGGVGSVIGLSNARVAALCRAPVLIVCRGGIGSAVDAVALNLALYRSEGARPRVVVANKLIPAKRAQALGYLGKAFGGSELTVIGGLDYSPVLANPTLASLSQLLGVTLAGDREQRTRIVYHIQLGAASTQRCVDLLARATLLVTTSTRDELIVTLASLYPLPEYRERIAGLVIAGRPDVSRVSQRILDASGLPYLRVPRPTGDVFHEVTEFVSKIGAEDREKLDWIREAGQRQIDFDAIVGAL
jgi:hypothetical protein